MNYVGIDYRKRYSVVTAVDEKGHMIPRHVWIISMNLNNMQIRNILLWRNNKKPA
jgi:hypothetical protein